MASSKEKPQEPKKPQNKTHKVAKGDTLTGIAKKYGVKDWNTIWNFPENSSVVSERKKPELIQAGDSFIVPPSEKELKEYEKALADYEKALKEIEDEEEQLTQKADELKEQAKSLYEQVDVQLKEVADALQTEVGNLGEFLEAILELDDDSRVVGWVLKNGSQPAKFPDKNLLNDAESAAKDMAAMAPDKNVLYKSVGETFSKARESLEKAESAIRDFLKDSIKDGGLLKESSCAAVSALFDYDPFLDSDVAGVPENEEARVDHNQRLVDALKSLSGQIASVSLTNTKQDPKAVSDAAAKFARDEMGKIDNPEFTKLLCEALVPKVKAPGFTITKDLVSDWLSGSGAAPMKAAIKSQSSGIKADTPMDAFVAKVADELADDFPAKGLSDWIDKNLVKRVFDLLKGILPKGITLPDFTKLFQPFRSIVMKVAQQVLEKTIAKAKTAEEIGQEIAEVLIKHGVFKGPLQKALDIWAKLKGK